MLDLIFLCFTLFITYLVGRNIEKKHFKSLQQREIALIKKPIINFGAKKWRPKRPIRKMEIVSGEVVISGDYFKNFVAGIKNIVGGRLTPFESIMDRARREAILRMREKAKNAHIIVNTRIEAIMVNDTFNPNSIPQCAVIAYGTAVTYEKPAK